MKKLLTVLSVFMRVRIKGEFEYRMSFYIDTLSFVLGYGSQALLMYLMVDSFHTINGWTPLEVMMLYAYTLASYTLCNMFLCNITDNLIGRVRSGEFDLTLVRPMNPLLFEISTAFSGYYFLHFLMALCLIVIGFVQMNVVFSVGKLLVAATSIIGGALIQGGVLLLFSSASFGLINNPLTSGMYSSIRSIIEYPITIYPKPVQFLFTFIIPLAFVGFFPVQNLGGSTTLENSPLVLQCLSLPVGVVFFGLACCIWIRALNSYKSTGS